MMKRIFSLALAILMLGAMISGCSEPEDPVIPTDPAGPTVPPGGLYMTHLWYQKDGVDEFECGVPLNV